MRDPVSIASDGYLSKYKRTLSIATRGYLSTYAIIVVKIGGTGTGPSGKKINVKDLSKKKREKILMREDNEIIIIIETFINKLY